MGSHKPATEAEIAARLEEARRVILDLVPEHGRILIDRLVDASQLGQRAWPAIGWLVTHGHVQCEREQFYTYLCRPNGKQPRRSDHRPVALPVAIEPPADDIEERF